MVTGTLWASQRPWAIVKERCREETGGGSWLLRVKEMSTSKCGGWACRIIFTWLMPIPSEAAPQWDCLGILSLWASLKLPKVMFKETCQWFSFCVYRLHDDWVTQWAVADHHRHPPLCLTQPGFCGPHCHITEKSLQSRVRTHMHLPFTICMRVSVRGLGPGYCEK